jgi:hypothetical protein
MVRNGPEAGQTALRGDSGAGLDLDLEHLQEMMDNAVEQIRGAFTRMGEAVGPHGMDADVRGRIAEESRRVIASLQFHDIASQLIAKIRTRAALLELAARARPPDLVDGQSDGLLARVDKVVRHRPVAVEVDRRGDVDLF